MAIAHCTCRACAVEVAGDFKVNALCHCDNCRRRTGSAFGWSVYVKDEQVVARNGPLKTYGVATDPPQQRWFCETCGTTLLWKWQKFPKLIGLAGGCFEPLPSAPTLSAENERCVDWVRAELAVKT
jgi:hypothetical protein